MRITALKIDKNELTHKHDEAEQFIASGKKQQTIATIVGLTIVATVITTPSLNTQS